jgi:predicted nucleotidyltransferase
MYSVEDREALSTEVLDLAQADPRVVAGAVVGSLAFGGGDRWSDIDLTFAVRDDVRLTDVLDDWTERLVADRDAVVLFDLPSGETIYRVFFLPGGLQLDVSVSPSSSFAPGSPRFRLLFGHAGEAPPAPPPSAHELFGWAVAYAREARACIARERFWQAAHSISEIREHALALSCLRRDLPTRFGRGYDDLPRDVLARLETARTPSLDRDDLLASLESAVDGLLAESDEVGELATKAGSRLREFLGADS